MIKHAVPAVLGLLALCMTVQAQSRDAFARTEGEIITADELDDSGASDIDSALALARPDLFSTVDGSVLIHGLPVLTLLDGRRFPISTELGRMGMTPLDLFPLAFVEAVEVQKVHASLMYGSDTPGGVVNLRTNRVYTGGEVGMFYGRSSGKYGREDFSSYIIGTVGTDKFRITAGAAYQESSASYPRVRYSPQR